MLRPVIYLACMSVTLVSALPRSRECICGASMYGDPANVYACADVTCNVIGSVVPGECHSSHGAEDGWVRISFNDQEGWIEHDPSMISGPQQCGGAEVGACTARLCPSFQMNTPRTCDPDGCGNFGASRGSRLHAGTDVQCSLDDQVQAPFAGTLVRFADPYGDGSCCDVGFLIYGAIASPFEGHEAKIFYCDPYPELIGHYVEKGQPVASHRSLHCGCYDPETMTDHIHYQLDRYGKREDPASWLFCDQL